MRKSRFQNKVATGKFTLPVAAVFATLLWGAEGIYTPDRLWGWVACGLTAYLWVETNNAHSLIRIRSRLTPALYLFMAGCIFGLHPLQDGTLAALFMLASYYLLFKSYQETEAVGLLFHAFLCLGVGSVFFHQLLYFSPFYLWYAVVYLRSLTWRTLWAAIVGLALPYWFWAGYALYADGFDAFARHFLELARFQPLSGANYHHLDSMQVASFGWVILFTLVAALHCLSTSFNDKIRTRMLLQCLLVQELLIVAFMALQPVQLSTLTGLLVMNSAPVLSHYFALTNKRFTNILFILFLILFTLLALMNLWTRLSIS